MDATQASVLAMEVYPLASASITLAVAYATILDALRMWGIVTW